jgi:Alcohol dehydrogenase GroES-like domain
MAAAPIINVIISKVCMMPKFKASRATNSEVIAAATAERKRKSQAILKPILSVRDCSATGHDKSRTGMRILREAGPASLTRVKLEERPLSYLAHACVRREMHAMVLTAPGAPLRLEAREDSAPGPGDVRVKVGACGACRTDLHVVDGELPGIAYPIVSRP